MSPSCPSGLCWNSGRFSSFSGTSPNCPSSYCFTYSSKSNDASGLSTTVLTSFGRDSPGGNTKDPSSFSRRRIPFLTMSSRKPMVASWMTVAPGVVNLPPVVGSLYTYVLLGSITRVQSTFFHLSAGSARCISAKNSPIFPELTGTLFPGGNIRFSPLSSLNNRRPFIKSSRLSPMRARSLMSFPVNFCWAPVLGSV